VFPVERVGEDVTVRAVEDCRKGIDTRIDDQFVPQPPLNVLLCVNRQPAGAKRRYYLRQMRRRTLG
jgi:hypothetical protein